MLKILLITLDSPYVARLREKLPSDQYSVRTLQSCCQWSTNMITPETVVILDRQQFHPLVLKQFIQLYQESLIQEVLYLLGDMPLAKNLFSDSPRILKYELLERNSNGTDVVQLLSTLVPQRSLPLLHSIQSIEYRYDAIGRMLNEGNNMVMFTPQEARLFEHLLGQLSKVVVRERLEQILSGQNNSSNPNLLDVHLCGLRAKLRDQQVAFEVKTIHGQGYRLVRKPKLIG